MSTTRADRTAIRRTALSRPVALALNDGLIHQERTFFDYGCGRGDDLLRLHKMGIPVSGWDPAFFPDEERSAADIVNLGYVVNVIEDPAERVVVLAAAWELARKMLIVSARLDWEATDAAVDFQGDGIVTGKRTFQKFFTQEELRQWIEQALDRRPIAAAPGIFYVFRGEADVQSFAVNRVSRQRRIPDVEQCQELVSDHKELVETLMAFVTERGRLPGLYPALVVLGIYDRCTPKLASDASRAVAMLSSLAEAQAQLRSEGIALDIKTLRSTAYRYAARARAAQQSAACGLLDRVTGKRVVVSLDGGRVRVRRKKRGPKTKKGRNRFHTDWKEPKLLILYVVGDDGRPSQTWAPIIDGTLRGPEAVFALLLSYARQIGLNAADKVLFIADGAPWIWRRLQRLIAALGLSPTQVLGLIDFYHAAKQLSDAVKLRRWSATQRTRWLNRTRGLLKRARVDEVITALRELCRGRTAGKIRTHLNYFLKNRHRFAYTTMVGLGLPRGSGAVESAIRRVINLRIKGASIYWLPESVDAILLLRSFYKSGRWNCLQRMAMTPVGVSA